MTPAELSQLLTFDVMLAEPSKSGMHMLTAIINLEVSDIPSLYVDSLSDLGTSPFRSWLVPTKCEAVLYHSWNCSTACSVAYWCF